MAIHESIPLLLKESLSELIFVADYCVNYRKENPQWPKKQIGGCLGFPASILLFSIVDAIGSYYRDRADFIITVDGRDETIKNDGFHHFYILNSDYYDKQNLSGEFIKKIYNNYRSLLIHNAALPFNHFLEIGNVTDKPFDVKREDRIDVISNIDSVSTRFQSNTTGTATGNQPLTETLSNDELKAVWNAGGKPSNCLMNNGKNIPVVNVLPFLNISKKAVEEFIKKVDTLSGSKQMKGIEKRK